MDITKTVILSTLLITGTMSAASTNETPRIQLYSIGNSLTGPMRNENYFPKLMEMMSYEYHYGFHYKGGAGLKYMWEHPDDTGGDDLVFGKYRDVLTTENQFDFVLLEPFSDDLDTDKIFAQNFIDLIDAHNTNATILIYAHWPRKIYIQSDPTTCLDFDQLWLWTAGPMEHDGVSYSFYPEESKQHFDQLVPYLRSLNPDRKILLFPAAHAFYEFNQLAKRGEIDRFSNVYDLLNDNIHPGPIGQYIVSCTLYSSVTKKSPIGLPYSNFFTSSIQNDALALTIQKLVLKVQQENSGLTGFPPKDNTGLLVQIRGPLNAAD